MCSMNPVSNIYNWISNVRGYVRSVWFKNDNSFFQQNERRGTGFVFDTAGKENIEAQKANLLKKFNEINEEKIEETQNDQKS